MGIYKCVASKKAFYFVIVLLAISIVITGCTSSSEIIRESADTYLSSDKAPNISAEELHALLYDDNPENDPFILSVRSPDHYESGHIPGAINIPWREVAKEENLAKLPKDRQVVVYCYTGHTASQITSLLNILGYDAVNLKFGMSAWTPNRDIAPGRYEEFKDSNNYPLIINGVEVPECPTCP